MKPIKLFYCNSSYNKAKSLLFVLFCHFKNITTYLIKKSQSNIYFNLEKLIMFAWRKMASHKINMKFMVKTALLENGLINCWFFSHRLAYLANLSSSHLISISMPLRNSLKKSKTNSGKQNCLVLRVSLLFYIISLWCPGENQHFQNKIFFWV